MIWEGKAQEIAAFSVQFVRGFNHPPVLVRDFDLPVKFFFKDAKLEQVANTQFEPVHSDLFQITLRETPWREEIDGRARNVLILVSAIEGYAQPRTAVAFSDSEAGKGLDENPQSITNQLEVALIGALDKRFPRVKP